jgi:hypothetical protein
MLLSKVQGSSMCGDLFKFKFQHCKLILSPLPWVSNRMAYVSRGYSWVTQLSPASKAFWKDLFLSLQDLDAELAAHMTCSIMY